MRRNRPASGFSLIELLLVLAILGIIVGIAVPGYFGQRRRARVIGDAMSNAQVLRMMLEARKTDNGLYGTASTTYTWTNGVASDTTFLPGFTPQGNSQMNYSVAIGATGLTYTLTVNDPRYGAGGGTGAMVFQTDQTGAQLFRLH